MGVDSSNPDRWWPVATASEVAVSDGFLPVRLFDVPWLLIRLDGAISAVRDECPHRRIPLSAGHRVRTEQGQRLECRYHGWQFDGLGACSQIPALGEGTVPPKMRVGTSRLIESHGVFWLAPNLSLDLHAPSPLLPLPVTPQDVEWWIPDPVHRPLAAEELLVRIQGEIGGRLAPDGWSLQLESATAHHGVATMVAQPVTASASRLYLVWHGDGADGSAFRSTLWKTVVSLNDELVAETV